MLNTFGFPYFYYLFNLHHSRSCSLNNCTKTTTFLEFMHNFILLTLLIKANALLSHSLSNQQKNKRLCNLYVSQRSVYYIWQRSVYYGNAQSATMATLSLLWQRYRYAYNYGAVLRSMCTIALVNQRPNKNNHTTYHRDCSRSQPLIYLRAKIIMLRHRDQSPLIFLRSPPVAFTPKQVKTSFQDDAADNKVEQTIYFLDILAVFLPVHLNHQIM